MSIIPAHLFPPHLNAALGNAETELHRAALRFVSAAPSAADDRPRRRELFDLVRNFLRLASIHKTFQALDTQSTSPSRSRRPLVLPPLVLETLPLLESAVAALLPQSPDQPWDSPEFRVPWTLACRLIAVRRELGPGAPPSAFPTPSAPPPIPPPPDAPASPTEATGDCGLADPESLSPSMPPSEPPAAPADRPVAMDRSPDGLAPASPMRPLRPIALLPSNTDPPPSVTPGRSPFSSLKFRISERPRASLSTLLICVHRYASVVQILLPALVAPLLACIRLLTRPLAAALPLLPLFVPAPAAPALAAFPDHPAPALRRSSSSFKCRPSVPQLLARPQPP